MEPDQRGEYTIPTLEQIGTRVHAKISGQTLRCDQAIANPGSGTRVLVTGITLRLGQWEKAMPRRTPIIRMRKWQVQRKAKERINARPALSPPSQWRPSADIFARVPQVSACSAMWSGSENKRAYLRDSRKDIAAQSPAPLRRGRKRKLRVNLNSIRVIRVLRGCFYSCSV
jgi:hypothetical protein